MFPVATVLCLSFTLTSMPWNAAFFSCSLRPPLQFTGVWLMEPDAAPELCNCAEGLHPTLANVSAEFLVQGHGEELIVLGSKGWKENKWTISPCTRACSPSEHDSTTPHQLFITSLPWAQFVEVEEEGIKLSVEICSAVCDCFL